MSEKHKIKELLSLRMYVICTGVIVYKFLPCRKERRRQRNRHRAVPTLPTAFPSLEPITTESPEHSFEVHDDFKQPGNLTKASVREPAFNSGQLMRYI